MPGHSATVRLQLNIPPSVTRLMITQEGTVHSGQKQPARFVSAEAVFPAVGRP